MCSVAGRALLFRGKRHPYRRACGRALSQEGVAPSHKVNGRGARQGCLTANRLPRPHVPAGCGTAAGRFVAAVIRGYG